MAWDLGIRGIGVLIGMAVGFGLLAQLTALRGAARTRWMWLIGTSAFFIAGLLTSEVWFGWATEDELQPNIDGLSFDETLLFGLLAGVASVLVTRHLVKRQHHR